MIELSRKDADLQRIHQLTVTVTEAALSQMASMLDNSALIQGTFIRQHASEILSGLDTHHQGHETTLGKERDRALLDISNALERALCEIPGRCQPIDPYDIRV